MMESSSHQQQQPQSISCREEVTQTGVGMTSPVCGNVVSPTGVGQVSPTPMVQSTTVPFPSVIPVCNIPVQTRTTSEVSFCS